MAEEAEEAEECRGRGGRRWGGSFGLLLRCLQGLVVASLPLCVPLLLLLLLSLARCGWSSIGGWAAGGVLRGDGLRHDLVGHAQ